MYVLYCTYSFFVEIEWLNDLLGLGVSPYPLLLRLLLLPTEKPAREVMGRKMVPWTYPHRPGPTEPPAF
jgi:hypothetical protein